MPQHDPVKLRTHIVSLLNRNKLAQFSGEPVLEIRRYLLKPELLTGNWIANEVRILERYLLCGWRARESSADRHGSGYNFGGNPHRRRWPDPG